MAVWLKCGPGELAFDDDVIPREALQGLLTLEALEAHAGARREALLAEAESAVAAMAAKARTDAAAVTRLGYAQGRRDAVRHWHAEAGAQRAAAAARHGTLRGRLADMVVQATARLVQGPVLDQYLQAALQALDGLAEAEQTLCLTLHPADSAVAQAAIDVLRPRWKDATVVKIIESDTLARGSCLCESAQGYVDASLAVQLATLRQAAMGALQDLPLPGEPPDELPGPGPDATPDLPPGMSANMSANMSPPRDPAPGRSDAGLPLPSYFPYADDYGDDDPDAEDDGFDDDGAFGDEPAPEGTQVPRW